MLLTKKFLRAVPVVSTESINKLAANAERRKILAKSPDSDSKRNATAESDKKKVQIPVIGLLAAVNRIADGDPLRERYKVPQTTRAAVALETIPAIGIHITLHLTLNAIEHRVFFPLSPATFL